MTSPLAQPRRRLDRRERLLQAAAQVLLRGGVQALTLDAVAREASTSKGGLLHHFPSKATLRESLLEDVIARIRQDLVRRAQADSDPRGRRLRAYVDALVVPARDNDRPRILAALLFDPVAILRWRTFSDQWLGPDLDGIDPGRCDAVRILADGSWLAMALGLRPGDDGARAARVRHYLKRVLT